MSNGARNASDSITRLYMLWIVTVALLVVALLVIIMLGSGRFRKHEADHAAIRSELADEVTRLNGEITDLYRKIETLRERRAIQPPQPRQREPEPSRPAVGPRRPEVPSDAIVRERLDQLLQPAEDLPYQLRDEAAADELLRTIEQHVSVADWSGVTWRKAALVARLAGHEPLAQTLARRAANAGAALDEYYGLVIRQLLGDERYSEALSRAREYLDATGSAEAAYLAARTYAALNRGADVHAALDRLGNFGPLSVEELLRLGRLYIRYERWGELRALVGELHSRGVQAAADHDFALLQAVVRIISGEYAPAYSMLDYWVNEGQADYDIRLWQARALIESRPEQATELLRSLTEESPSRPEAYYWLGVATHETEGADAAIPYWRQAIDASSGGYAPAHEELGNLALTQGEYADAVSQFQQAVQAAPRRASSYFLLALAYAHLGDRPTTERNLREALRLNPELLEPALQAAVLTEMIPPEELRSYAAARPDGA